MAGPIKVTAVVTLNDGTKHEYEETYTVDEHGDWRDMSADIGSDLADWIDDIDREDEDDAEYDGED